MAGKSYSARVLGSLRRVTPEEKQAIAQELNAHLEDHACALEEIGYTPEEALEKAEAAMGDPEEMARELDKQYPMGWLILKRAAVTLFILFCCVAFLNMGMLYFLWKSVAMRIDPSLVSAAQPSERAYASQEVNLKMRVGSDVVRVFWVSTDAADGVPTAAHVAVCTYDRLPGGTVSEAIGDGLTLRSPDGSRTANCSISTENWCTMDGTFFLPLEPGDEELILECTLFGETCSMPIPLPKEGQP